MSADLTGGLVYHLRAWRYRKKLWQPFRQHLNLWLAEQFPSRQTLIWVGSSAGYCVDPEITTSFQQILVCEPDPLAGALLKRRHSNLRVIKSDLLELNTAQPFARFAELLETYPKADVLFSNILGQFAYIAHGQTEKLLEQLRMKLKGRRWVSFHDRLSVRHPHLTVQREHLQSQAPLTGAALVESFFGTSTPLTVLDHYTEALEKGMKPLYLHWQLTPRQHHLIGCVQHQPSDG